MSDDRPVSDDRPASVERRAWAAAGVAGVFLALVVAAVAFVAVLVAVTRLPDPEVARASEILDHRGRPATKLYIQNRETVSLDELPPYLPQAVIAIEDERFWRHHGVDPVAILRALVRNLSAGRTVEGGSTITQQLVRNLWLTQARSWERKFTEALLALKVETRWSKPTILQLYLNQVYFGEGAYGVEVAARRYFGKSARQLTLGEAALLAGVIKSPTNLSPYKAPDAALARRVTVLERMVRLGYISRREADAAQAERLELANEDVPLRRFPWYVDYILRELEAVRPDVARNVFVGGYRITTGLDPQLQEAAEAAVAEHLPARREDPRGVTQPQVAAVALDPMTGAVRALIGGRDWSESPFNRAVQSRRQPGSAFKPFVYAAVLEAGYTAASVQVCEPVSFPTGVRGRRYTPRDYGSPDYHNRPFTVRPAIQISDNVVAVRWAATIGPERIADVARRLGITSKLEATLPLALGTSGVAPVEMARAFAPFTNGGYRVESFGVLKVEDADGRVLYEARPRRRQVLDPRIAFILTDIMRTVVRPGGTAGFVERVVGRPVAGKTGTSNELRDAWFVGYTPDLVAAVWVGDDDDRVPVGTGGRRAAPIWAAMVRDGLAGRPPAGWTAPPGILRVAIDARNGLLANPFSPAIEEWFIAGTEPTEVSPLYPEDLPPEGVGELAPPEWVVDEWPADAGPPPEDRPVTEWPPPDDESPGEDGAAGGGDGAAGGENAGGGEDGD